MREGRLDYLGNNDESIHRFPAIDQLLREAMELLMLKIPLKLLNQTHDRSIIDALEPVGHGFIQSVCNLVIIVSPCIKLRPRHAIKILRVEQDPRPRHELKDLMRASERVLSKHLTQILR